MPTHAIGDIVNVDTGFEDMAMEIIDNWIPTRSHTRANSPYYVMVTEQGNIVIAYYNSFFKSFFLSLVEN